MRSGRFVAHALLLAMGIMSEPAFAQESFPWTRFVQSIERKGDDVSQEGPCSHLGLDPKCRAYQAAYQEDDWLHVFNVIRVRGSRTGHLILYKRSDTGAGLFFLTDLKGKLLRATSRAEGTGGTQSSWSRLTVSSPEVRQGFAEEVAFWRSKQSEFESGPDRKK